VKSVESEWFCKYYLDGMTAPEWVAMAKVMNNASTSSIDNEKNALSLAEIKHQATHHNIHQPSTPTADNFSTP
jgi:hypothetical protein